jgi:DNA primase
MDKRRYYIIGDIHGYYIKLKRLFDIISGEIRENDIIIFLGDYIDRGPDGKSVEELLHKEIVRALRQKIPVEQVMDKYSLKDSDSMKAPAVQRLPKQKERRTVEIPRVAAPTKLKKRPIKQREFPHESVAVQALPEEEQEVVEVVKLSPAAKKFKSHADELMGTFGARFLDAGNNVIGETAVRDLVNNLKNYNGDIKSVIFDGVITQRILDIAENKGIENLVGAKIGSITKRPSSVKILTVRDL